MKSRVLALDFETNGKPIRWSPEWRVTGWSLAEFIAPDRPESVYIPVGHLVDNVPDPTLAYAELRQLLSTPGIIWVWHNALHELDVLHRLEMPIPEMWYCTQQLAHWIDENIKNPKLDALSKKFLGKGKVDDPTMAAIISKWGWAHVPPWMIDEYGRIDSELTLQLFFKFLPRFVSEGFDERLKGFELIYRGDTSWGALHDEYRETNCFQRALQKAKDENALRGSVPQS